LRGKETVPRAGFFPSRVAALVIFFFFPEKADDRRGALRLFLFFFPGSRIQSLRISMRGSFSLLFFPPAGRDSLVVIESCFSFPARRIASKKQEQSPSFFFPFYFKAIWGKWVSPSFFFFPPVAIAYVEEWLREGLEISSFFFRIPSVQAYPPRLSSSPSLRENRGRPKHDVMLLPLFLQNMTFLLGAAFDIPFLLSLPL